MKWTRRVCPLGSGSFCFLSWGRLVGDDHLLAIISLGLTVEVLPILVFSITLLFRAVSALQKNYKDSMESPHVPCTQSLLHNILCWCCTLGATYEPILIIHQKVNPILCSYPMPYFCSRTPSRTPRDIQLSCLLSFLLALRRSWFLRLFCLG